MPVDSRSHIKDWALEIGSRGFPWCHFPHSVLSTQDSTKSTWNLLELYPKHLFALLWPYSGCRQKYVLGLAWPSCTGTQDTKLKTWPIEAGYGPIISLSESSVRTEQDTWYYVSNCDNILSWQGSQTSLRQLPTCTWSLVQNVYYHQVHKQDHVFCVCM